MESSLFFNINSFHRVRVNYYVAFPRLCPRGIWAQPVEYTLAEYLEWRVLEMFCRYIIFLEIEITCRKEVSQDLLEGNFTTIFIISLMPCSPVRDLAYRTFMLSLGITAKYKRGFF